MKTEPKHSHCNLEIYFSPTLQQVHLFFLTDGNRFICVSNKSTIIFSVPKRISNMENICVTQSECSVNLRPLTSLTFIHCVSGSTAHMWPGTWTSPKAFWKTLPTQQHYTGRHKYFDET